MRRDQATEEMGTGRHRRSPEPEVHRPYPGEVFLQGFPEPDGGATVEHDGRRTRRRSLPCLFQPPDFILVPIHHHPQDSLGAESPDYMQSRANYAPWPGLTESLALFVNNDATLSWLI